MRQWQADDLVVRNHTNWLLLRGPEELAEVQLCYFDFPFLLLTSYFTEIFYKNTDLFPTQLTDEGSANRVQFLAKYKMFVDFTKASTLYASHITHLFSNICELLLSCITLQSNEKGGMFNLWLVKLSWVTFFYVKSFSWSSLYIRNKFLQYSRITFYCDEQANKNCLIIDWH